MKRNSKEFDNLRKQFESDVKCIPIYIGGKVQRETGNLKDVYYTNGTINALFMAYMWGYQSAKSLARLGALELDE